MQYAAPKSVQDAVELLAGEAGVARVLAGGTDVLVQMKMGMIEPDLLLDIKNIVGLKDITAEAGGFRIGAAVSGAELGEHVGVSTLWPGVVEAVELIGSTQVQGRATMAGNLCNASPAGDSVPAMAAAGAVARIAGPEGIRDCLVADIPTAPGRTSLGNGEFITSIFLPERPDNASDAYLRFIPRTEMDIAVASAAVSLEFDAGGKCSAAKVVLGAVGPTILNVDTDCLLGTTLDDAALEALAAACSATATPIDDKRGTAEFRKDVVGVLAKRAAKIAQTRAGVTS